MKHRDLSETPTRPVLGLAITVGILGMLLIAELSPYDDADSDVGILIAIAVVAMISGLLVAKRPGHPVSWLLALSATIGGVAGLAAELLPIGLTEISWWQGVLAIVSGPSWYGLLATLLVLIPLLFPTGSPPSPRWHWVAWLAIAAIGLMSAMWVVQERFCTDLGDGCFASVDNPLGISGMPNPEESALGGVFYGVLLICILGALASLVVRFRRAGPVERQQIKWLLFSLGLSVSGLLFVELLWMDVLGRSEPPGYAVVQQIVWVMIPASIAVAILRYRLYDIDRIISRTLSYGLVAGLLGLVYFGLVTASTSIVRSDEPMIVAIATLAVAAMFNPLRKRVQEGIDRRFNRSRYDAQRLMDEFAASLQERVDSDGLIDGWVSVVHETMQPSTTGVWLRP